MTETRHELTQGQEPTQGLSSSGEARRNALRLGAIGAVSMVTIRPALAQTAVSILQCQIPIPDPANAGKWVAADGTLVPAGTAGAFSGPARAFTGEEVKQGLATGHLYATPYDQSQAYLNYIRKLQMGQSGFTCFASIQMPRP